MNPTNVEQGRGDTATRGHGDGLNNPTNSTTPINPMKAHVLAVVLVIVVGTLAYSNSFAVPFSLFDDTLWIQENVFVHSFRHLSQLWRSQPPRFVPFLTFLLNYHFGGANVFGYHLVNLLIHLANALLVYWLVLTTLRLSSALSPKPLALSSQPLALSSQPLALRSWALAAGLVFVAHPLQTQAVTYIVQRMESLAALFYLLTLSLYLKARLSPHPSPLPSGARGPISPTNLINPTNVEQRRGDAVTRGRGDGLDNSTNSINPMNPINPMWFWLCYMGALLSFVLGCMSKEIIVTAPVLLVVYEWFFLPPPTPGPSSPSRLSALSSRLPYLLPFLLLIPLPLVLAMLNPKLPLTAFHGPGEQSGVFFGDPGYWWRYILTQGWVLWTYVRLFFLPIGQNLDYDYPLAQGLLDFPFLLVWLGWGGAVLGTKFLFRHNPFGFAQDGRLVTLGLLWFFVTLSVTSLLPLGMVIFEHRMYLPLVGLVFVLLGVVLLLPSSLQRGLKWGTVLLVVPTLVWATYHRNLVWGSEERLWTDVVTKSPHKARGHINLSVVLRAQGDIEGARRHLVRAVELDPSSTEARNNLGTLLFLEGDPDGAIAHLQKALQLDPGNAEAHNNMGNAWRAKGDLKRAIFHYVQAVVLSPYQKVFYYGLASALHADGQSQAAVAILRRALALFPGDPTVTQMLQEYTQQTLSRDAETR